MADLIVVLGDARVVEAGSHEELMARRGLYAELYDLQARAYRRNVARGATGGAEDMKTG